MVKTTPIARPVSSDKYANPMGKLKKLGETYLDYPVKPYEGLMRNIKEKSKSENP